MLAPACMGCPGLQTVSLGNIPTRFSLPSLQPPPDLDLTQLSPPWDWIGKPGLDRQTHIFCAHPKPQLQRSWRYILSSACFLAPIQTHNEWSRSPQPGATPSTLFTLLPFTHSSCSSPNDAGPSYWLEQGKQGAVLSLARLQTRPFSIFWNQIPLL